MDSSEKTKIYIIFPVAYDDAYNYQLIFSEKD